MNSFLTVPERVAFCQVVAQLGDFADRRGRAGLLELAGLGRFVPGIDLNGSASTVAGDLVVRLEKYGALPDQPTTHALGALAFYILNLADLSPGDGRTVAEIVVKYSLVADADYLTKLRADFKLNSEVVSRPPPTALPPRGTVAANGPEFTPGLADTTGLEAVINSEDNFLDIMLLAGAMYCAQAVCRIEGADHRAIGTGVLIAPDLVLTNHHVLKSKDHLEGVVARFDYKLVGGLAQEGRAFAVRQDFYEASPETALDYALVRLESAPLAHLTPLPEHAHAPIAELAALGRHRGYVEAASRFIKEGERVNIIQHPDGDPLKVVLTQNYVVADMTEQRVQYVADTMPGSSGSPVFNGNWEFVAIHHAGAPFPPDTAGALLKKAWKGRFRVNEGIPLRAILDDLRARGLDRYLPAKLA